MKRTTILLFLYAILSCCMGQTFEKTTWKDKKISVEYTFYKASANPEYTLVVFSDQNQPGYNADSVLKSLVPLANAKNALLALPNLPTNLLNNQIDGWIKSLQIDGKPIRFIAISNASSVALGQSCLNEAGVLIHPNLNDSIKIQVNSSNPLIAILSEESLPINSGLLDSLKKAGYWIHSEKSKISSVETAKLLNEFAWIDSMQTAINDSVDFAKLKKSAGLKNKVPGTLRQGQKLELDVFVANQGEYILQVLNLNAQPIYYNTPFLGKGLHHFEIPTKSFDWGVYHVEVIGKSIRERHKFMIKG